MTKKLIFLIPVLFVCQYAFPQGNIDTVDISFLKTTSIIFQYPIVNVDRGSSDVIAQKVKDVQNILQIKAARRSFPATNVTVITTDGSLHHFFIGYSESPAKQVYRMNDKTLSAQLHSGRSEIAYEIATDGILNSTSKETIARGKDFRIKLAVSGIYAHDDMMFFKIHIRNKSNIKYDIQSFRFFVRDKKKLKRTSIQEIELTPLYIRNETSVVNGNSSCDIVYVLNKFTIPDAKTLDIELFEKNGGRNLKVRLDNHSIVKAHNLPLK